MASEGGLLHSLSLVGQDDSGLYNYFHNIALKNALKRLQMTLTTLGYMIFLMSYFLAEIRLVSKFTLRSSRTGTKTSFRSEK